MALDYGIDEKDFWEMTLSELERKIDSCKRVEKQRLQEKAYFDYTLADLVGRSVARLYSSSSDMPQIEDVYPSIFNTKEIKERKEKERKDLSIIRFK